MREPIHKYFQIGLIAFMAYPACMRDPDADIPAFIREIACDDFFTAIELNPVKKDSHRRQITKMLSEAHMKVCYGGQARLLGAGLNPNHPDEAERKKAEDTLLAGIDEAQELGADAMAFLSGRWEEATKELSYRQLLKTTRNLCAYARTKNMRIELEVFDYDIDKKALIGPCALAARFAADVRSVHDNFGLLVDLSHIPMCRERSRAVIRTLRPYLTHFHIGNTVISSPQAPAYGDEHPRFGFPGSENDTAQVVEFLSILKSEGFFNVEKPYVLSFEVKPWGNETPGAVIANSKRVLRRAWALLE